MKHILYCLDQGLPTCGTRTTGGTQKLFKWYARYFPKMQKELVSTESLQKLFYFNIEITYMEIVELEICVSV